MNSRRCDFNADDARESLLNSPMKISGFPVTKLGEAFSSMLARHLERYVTPTPLKLIGLSSIGITSLKWPQNLNCPFTLNL